MHADASPSPARPTGRNAVSTQAPRPALDLPQVQALAQGYQETAVDLRLEGVQLPELLALLVAIDQAPYGLQVRHLQIRPKFDNPVNLDATVRVLSYAKG